MKILVVGLILLFGSSSYGQINLKDSTVQVIGYWSKKEKQTYAVTQETYKVKGTDTTSREFTKYFVDVTVVDSTADSYIIDWAYRDYSMDTDNKIIKNLMAETQNIKVQIRTNQMGTFSEVVNWEEIRDYIKKVMVSFKNEYDTIPQLTPVFAQIESMFSTKEAIEQAVIKEIKQFYFFHGASYKMGEEYQAQSQVNNIYGGEPFDVDIVAWLHDINSDESIYTLYATQTVNQEQLSNAVFDYLTRMAITMKVKGPNREDIPTISNKMWFVSTIHDSGWVVSSAETKETVAEGVTKVEDRIIELQ